MRGRPVLSRLTFVFLFPFLQLLNSWSNACQQNDGRSDEKSFKMRAEAASLIEACYLNVSALDRFDVLIRINEFGDSVATSNPNEASMIKDEVAFHRVIVDVPKNRFFHAGQGSSKLLVFNEAGHPREVEETEKRFTNGFLVDKENRFEFFMPNRVMKLTSDVTVKELMSRHDVTDIRLFGIGPFGSGSADEISQYVPSGDEVQRIDSISDSRTDIMIQSTGGNFGMQTVLSVDRNNMAISKIVQTVLKPDGKRYESDWATETIDWSEIKGSVVAKRSKREVKAIARIGGNPHVYSKIQTADIHCFSVNEELDESLFDPENIRKLDRLLKMCDPEAAGATTLLEKKKEQSTEDKK